MRFVNSQTRVLVHGITGRQGRFHTRLMLDYGTRVVAGVTPGKGGESVEGIPVYDTVAEAMDRHRIDSSIIFVPALYAPDAVYEAIEACLDPIVVITEGIPIRDTMEMVAWASRRGVTVIGPNTPGVIKVGECKLGIMPARVFERGRVSIISRSGTLTYEIADHISHIGLGESTCVGLGGDPITGIDFVDALRWFEEDPETEAVALIGEIGGEAEERAAEFIAEGGFTKPAVAYIAGRTAIPGKRMGHAGAIIQGSRGTARSKIEALESADVPVAERPSDVARLLKKLLG